ncbi:hypothetical protein [Leptothoe spongobia]|uniref:Uncharacterized protein n=1 Tax=Leptothoe spongobia TAU-MAC 1115 TaxID=1967444 RepID=A0A947DDT8_9CYAN|nr:hypothetical protein [Leptothoe spongobia]MBT9314504.1 hypothetical protein [Leptothoe spongobia TAU-MAC 1115]
MAKQLGHRSPLGSLRPLGASGWGQRRLLGTPSLSFLDLKTFYPHGFPSRAPGATSSVGEGGQGERGPTSGPAGGVTSGPVSGSTAQLVSRQSTSAITAQPDPSSSPAITDKIPKPGSAAQASRQAVSENRAENKADGEAIAKPSSALPKPGLKGNLTQAKSFRASFQSYFMGQPQQQPQASDSTSSASPDTSLTTGKSPSIPSETAQRQVSSESTSTDFPPVNVSQSIQSLQAPQQPSSTTPTVHSTTHKASANKAATNETLASVDPVQAAGQPAASPPPTAESGAPMEIGTAPDPPAFIQRKNAQSTDSSPTDRPSVIGSDDESIDSSQPVVSPGSTSSFTASASDRTEQSSNASPPTLAADTNPASLPFIQRKRVQSIDSQPTDHPSAIGSDDESIDSPQTVVSPGSTSSFTASASDRTEQSNNASPSILETDTNSAPSLPFIQRKSVQSTDNLQTDRSSVIGSDEGATDSHPIVSSLGSTSSFTAPEPNRAGQSSNASPSTVETGTASTPPPFVQRKSAQSTDSSQASLPSVIGSDEGAIDPHPIVSGPSPTSSFTDPIPNRTEPSSSTSPSTLEAGTNPASLPFIQRKSTQSTDSSQTDRSPVIGSDEGAIDPHPIVSGPSPTSSFTDPAPSRKEQSSGTSPSTLEAGTNPLPPPLIQRKSAQSTDSSPTSLPSVIGSDDEATDHSQPVVSPSPTSSFTTPEPNRVGQSSNASPSTVEIGTDSAPSPFVQRKSTQSTDNSQTDLASVTRSDEGATDPPPPTFSSPGPTSSFTTPGPSRTEQSSSTSPATLEAGTDSASLPFIQRKSVQSTDISQTDLASVIGSGDGSTDPPQPVVSPSPTSSFTAPEPSRTEQPSSTSPSTLETGIKPAPSPFIQRKSTQSTDSSQTDLASVIGSDDESTDYPHPVASHGSTSSFTASASDRTEQSSHASPAILEAGTNPASPPFIQRKSVQSTDSSQTDRASVIGSDEGATDYPQPVSSVGSTSSFTASASDRTEQSSHASPAILEAGTNPASPPFIQRKSTQSTDSQLTDFASVIGSGDGSTDLPHPTVASPSPTSSFTASESNRAGQSANTSSSALETGPNAGPSFIQRKNAQLTDSQLTDRPSVRGSNGGVIDPSPSPTSSFTVPEPSRIEQPSSTSPSTLDAGTNPASSPFIQRKRAQSTDSPETDRLSVISSDDGSIDSHQPIVSSSPTSSFTAPDPNRTEQSISTSPSTLEAGTDSASLPFIQRKSVQSTDSQPTDLASAIGSNDRVIDPPQSISSPSPTSSLIDSVSTRSKKSTDLSPSASAVDPDHSTVIQPKSDLPQSSASPAQLSINQERSDNAATPSIVEPNTQLSSPTDVSAPIQHLNNPSNSPLDQPPNALSQSPKVSHGTQLPTAASAPLQRSPSPEATDVSPLVAKGQSAIGSSSKPGVSDLQVKAQKPIHQRSANAKPPEQSITVLPSASSSFNSSDVEATLSTAQSSFPGSGDPIQASAQAPNVSPTEPVQVVQPRDVQRSITDTSETTHPHSQSEARHINTSQLAPLPMVLKPLGVLRSLQSMGQPGTADFPPSALSEHTPVVQAASTEFSQKQTEAGPSVHPLPRPDSQDSRPSMDSEQVAIPHTSVDGMQLKVLKPIGVLRPLPSLKSSVVTHSQTNQLSAYSPSVEIPHSSTPAPPNPTQANPIQRQITPQNRDEEMPSAWSSLEDLVTHMTSSTSSTPSSAHPSPPASNHTSAQSSPTQSPEHSTVQRQISNQLSDQPPEKAFPSTWSNIEDLVTHFQPTPNPEISAQEISAPTLSTPTIPTVTTDTSSNSTASAPPTSINRTQSTKHPVDPPVVSIQRKLDRPNPPPTSPVNVIQTAQDLPTVTIRRKANANQGEDAHAIQNYSHYLELLAQEVYGLLRQRLCLEQERRGPKYPR